MNSGIYMLYWRNNSYFYIGQSQNLSKRQKDHFYLLENNKHYNKKMQNIYVKYGFPTFQIVEFSEIEKLNEIEQWWLDEFVGTKNCLNIARCAEAPMRGLTVSEERRRKMSEVQKGKNLSEKTKKKISDANSGENHYRFGKKCSERQRKNMSEAQKKKILQFSKNGEFIKEWPSASDASLCLKIDRRNISNCCIGFGRVKSAGGFVWKFKKGD